ncbi:Retrovirus-related Pol polyprotein from transposon TNT 1-94 [Vitis vinifera]|uniref:Retrovirus-related Pol polyprotein from transposon TNT 1-94 n=1 Tax=Vitis vinifera TaxID=29760 RepID=A0A438BNN1_VITVI|nr:Retrovirus-related Pol polyprotein from transposon TNT 1-94 [Vitis vinifera]
MSTSSNTSSVIAVFNGEHYHIWVVKMRFYLRSQGLWNVVMSEANPPPLGANPTVAQMKAYEEKKLKKDKAITCLHSGLADHIFTKIMDLDTLKQVWDKLQGEFEGSNRVKIVKLLTLKREFEFMKMKDNESVKDYSSRLMDVVNQMRLLELISKLHVKEQRVLMRGDEAIEGAFQANHKGKSSGNLQGKKFFKNNKGKAEGSSRKENFLLYSHCNRTNHAEKDCWYKDQFNQRSSWEMVKLCKPKEKGQLLSTPREIDESVVWHTRYGHFNLKSLKFMQKAGIVEDMPEITVTAQTCESCELRKQHHKSFPQNMSKRATHKLELVHSDICGPMSTASLSNNVYFALFIDDLSRMTWVYFLKTKLQVLSVFKSFKKMVETQSGQKVKVLRTDNGDYRLSLQSKTPIEAWPGVIPSVKHLKVFGSLCYLHVPSIKRGKLDERAKKCVFVGFAAESRGYRIYSLSKMKIMISREVHFDENSYWNWDLKKVHKCDQTTPSILEPAVESTSLEDPLDVEATSDTPMLKVRPLSDVYERSNLVHAESTCYTKATRFPEWIEAMKPEIDATLVVNGFAQVVGVDYGDTFAPVARHDTIRLLLALAGQMGWKVYHLDVKAAFVNGILLEDIYVQQPEGFEEFNLESCKEVATLLAQNEKISKNDGEKLEEPSAYRSLIGSLLYLIATRPDLMFPAGFLSRFMSSPSNVHMGVSKSVLKYVKGTKNLGIWYLKTGGVKLDGYANSDWPGSVDDMKSTSSYVFTIGLGVI